MTQALIRSVIFISLCPLSCVLWANNLIQFSGHSKYRVDQARYNNENLYHQYFGDYATDQSANTRLNFSWLNDGWNTQADYQLIALYGDTLDLKQQLPSTVLPDRSIRNDDRRLFDLTRVLHEEQNHTLLHRLDRLYLGHTSEKLVIRFGRQAISWGNGLLYTPLDIFNPFDPAAIDKEYKPGDDLFYSQYLFNAGDDLQFVRVFRRDDNNNVKSNVSSSAIKLHAFSGNSEYDFLFAQHYADDIVGFGGNRAIGGAVWQADITVIRTKKEYITSLATGLSYSWVWGSKNYSGLIEYFYNGFGMDENSIDTDLLLEHADLLQRLQRGEIYTVGKHYLATSVTIELSPLWLLTPSIFQNLSDGSFLIQLLSRHDISQNLQLLLALDIPMGARGTEYGGIETDFDNLTLGKNLSVFAQIGWYF